MKRKPWTRDDVKVLRHLYASLSTKEVAQRMGRKVDSINYKAFKLGLVKDPAFKAEQLRKCGEQAGLHPKAIAARFKPGQVSHNKGLRRPGYAPGRMRETQFKKGQFPANKDPDFYVIGALRINTDGYIDMRTSFEPGAKGWRGLHLILWEDAHGPIPAGHCLRFRDGEKLNVCLENLELIHRGDNMRRNSVHNLPEPLVKTIQLAGALKRVINRRIKNVRDQEAQH